MKEVLVVVLFFCLKMAVRVLKVIFILLLNLEFSCSGCKYFSLTKNGTLEYFAPDVCYQDRENGTISSFKWECADDGQSVTGKYWPGSTNCNGVGKNNGTTFYKKDGYDMNCDSTASDCSSVYRIYAGCDTNKDDFTSLPIVMGMCGTLNGVSQKWQCTSSEEDVSVYGKPNCDEFLTKIKYKNGCDFGIYYQIQSCNN